MVSKANHIVDNVIWIRAPAREPNRIVDNVICLLCTCCVLAQAARAGWATAENVLFAAKIRGGERKKLVNSVLTNGESSTHKMPANAIVSNERALTRTRPKTQQVHKS